MIETTTWHALENQAVRRHHRGDADGAIAALEQAIAMTRDAADLTTETASMLNYLAGIYLGEGKLDRAESTIREALRRTIASPMNYADNLLILAEILHKQRRSRESARAGREGLRLVRQEYGWDHAYTNGAEKLLDQLGISYTNGWFLGIVPPRITSFFGSLRRLIAKSRQ